MHVKRFHRKVPLSCGKRSSGTEAVDGGTSWKSSALAMASRTTSGEMDSHCTCSTMEVARGTLCALVGEGDGATAGAACEEWPCPSKRRLGANRAGGI